MERRASRGGFTVLEVLVASAIFAIVSLGLVAGLVLSYRITLSNQLRDEAVSILREEVELIRERSYDEITPALNNGANDCEDALNGKNFVERQVGNVKRRFGIFLTVKEDSALEIKKVRIEVCWRERGNFKSVSGETLIAKD
ncbi:type IV pilus modification PilV family protein [Thermovibrio sp.]